MSPRQDVDAAVEPSDAAAAPRPLTFVTPVEDSLEAGVCVDGVCAVDPPG
ncbi:hypothetical protein [Litorihabitans aurantiacus]|nr:hypothetical protein [Litorihabitans aurantiacus]